MGLRFISEEDKVADEFLLTESSILQESLQKNITRDSNMAGEQPRQPRDLQGLLKFCMEATASEDAPAVVGDPAARLAAMDPERKAWLEEALDNMGVDVVEQLGNGIKLLLDSSADLETKEEVLDCLGTIDMACNFHKIGGFVAIKQCLASPHASLRSGAAHLVGEIGQNNPYCQERFLEEGFLQTLLDQLDKDTDPHCQVKSLYAVSCLVRESKQGLAMLANLDGWSVLVRALQKDDTKLRTKGCFFIGAVANAAPEVVEEMVSTGIVLHLATLLEAPHELSHEHVLRAMLSLVQGSTVARKEAQSVQGLLSRLEERLKELKGRDEGEETEDYCRQLLKELRLEEGVDR